MGNISYNTKLILSSQQNLDLISLLKAQKDVWNECSKVRFEKGTKNSIVELHNLFYKDFRENNPNIPSQIVISAEQSVLSTYRSAKSNKHKLKNHCIKKKLSLRLDKRMYSYKNEVLSLISLGKRIKCQPYIYPKLRELLNKYRFCDPLLFERNGEVWISLTFEIPELLVKKESATGIDVGCRIIAATSDGLLYRDKGFNARKRKIRYLKRQLQSKGTKSARRHLKKIKHKERNINKNFMHCLANQILKDAKSTTLVLEDITGIKRKKGFENKNRISQIPFFELKQILTYKAALLLEPKTVISVKPYFTSQIDCKTGKKDGVRKGRRYYSITGEIYDADLNAAVNIAKLSKLPVSYGNILDGQAVVTRLNVCKSIVTASNCSITSHRL